MKLPIHGALAGSSLLMFASFAHAQSSSSTAPAASDGSFGLEEIVVTARRRDERLVDVPISVNAVTSEDVAKLNLRKFEDIQSVVPGLTLSYSLDGTGASAAMRGVKMDVAASGYNGTVEFYLNDTPIIAEALFPLMYDLGQIEVLRGPQGTLRGRASPSGSITVTTRRPDLNEFGGSVSATGTDIGGLNGNGALNIPVVDGKLAVRLAAAYDENEFNRVENAFGGPDPLRRIKSGRASVRYEPLDTLSFDVTYQNLVQNIRAYDQFESANIFDPTQPASPVRIEADDRKGVSDTPLTQRIEYDNFNYRAQWAFAGQRINYAGAYSKRHNTTQTPLDPSNVFNANFPAFMQNVHGDLDSRGTQRAHELRLSSEERVFGLFDYTLGAFYQKTDTPTDVQRLTPVLFGLPSPTVGGLINLTKIKRLGNSEEKSGFANLTWHLGDKTEISGGVRYIDYQSEGSLIINGTALAAAAEDYSESTWIYTGSVKYNINADLMVYASTGSSWRPGISAIGDFSLARSPLENSFLVLPPEESKSYELGLKASAMDSRLQTSVALFHQKFDNYPYRASSGVFFHELAASSTPPFTPFDRVNTFNFVGAVPVDVNGIEAQASFAATTQWDVSVSGSYAKSEIKDGRIPCNDYFPRDGIPDSASGVPTLAQIAATGDNLAVCVANYRASNAPLWSGNVQSEYRLPISDGMDTYVRGLVTFNGASQSDPANAIDNVSSYSLLNVYFGLRDRKGAWDVTLYGKNLTDTERVLSRNSSPATTSYNIGATAVTGVSPYRAVSFTEPREFGINVRYAFGSR
jgi:iron complex outermembrane receptor protein